MPKQTFIFETIEAFLQASAGPSDMDTCDRTSRLEISQRGDDFFMSETFEAALELAIKGWPEGAKQARTISISAAENLQRTAAPRREWHRAVYGGGGLLVNSYLQGQPDCYLHKIKERSNNFIRLVLNVGAVGAVSSEILVRRGVTAAAVCEYLELNCYRVKIQFAYRNASGDYDAEWLVTLKNFNESLDLDRIAFFLGHPSCLRRLIFSHEETFSAPWRRALNIGNNYGRGSDTGRELLGEDSIYLGRADTGNNWHSVEAAIVEMKTVLAKKGIKI